MNRKNFIKLLGLCAIAPFIPLPKKPELPKLVTLSDKEIAEMSRKWQEHYTVVSHHPMTAYTLCLTKDSVVWWDLPHIT